MWHARGTSSWLLLLAAGLLVGLLVILVKRTDGLVFMIAAGMLVGFITIRIRAARRRREATREALRQEAAFASDLGRLLSLHPVEFERLVGSLLASSGYQNVTMTSTTGDQGVDLRCTDPDGLFCVVQCKRYAPGNHVSGPALRDLIGARQLAGAQSALFVTTSTFTRDAIRNAAQAGIKLIDGAALVTLARRVDMHMARFSEADACASQATGSWSRRERVLVVCAAVLILGGGVGAALPHGPVSSPAPLLAAPVHSAPRTPEFSPSTVQQPRSTTSGSSLGRGEATSVSIDTRAVQSDPHEATVAELFTTYFTGINSRKYQLAASVFAPNGYLGSDHRARISQMAATSSSTHDSDIVITWIAPAVIQGVPGLIAHVDFRSHQSADQGYAGQTCSLWSINYQLEEMGARYGLLGSAGDVHPTPCN